MINFKNLLSSYDKIYIKLTKSILILGEEYEKNIYNNINVEWDRIY